MRDSQRLVVMQHTEPFLSELDHEVLARARRTLDTAPLAGVEGRAKLDPKSTFIHEIPPRACAIGANEHWRALIARRVEHDLARWDDRLDRMRAREYRVATLQLP